MNTMTIIELAERIRADKLQGLAAYRVLDSWVYLGKSVEAELIHFLYHYIADADIRQKDISYRAYQELRLDGLLQRLR
jgi:hypothetical protein